jgi:hypothetical protein
MIGRSDIPEDYRGPLPLLAIHSVISCWGKAQSNVDPLWTTRILLSHRFHRDCAQTSIVRNDAKNCI